MGFVALAVGLVMSMLIQTSTPGPAAAKDEFQLMSVGRVYLDDVIPSPTGQRDVQLYLRAETLIGEPIHQLTSSTLAIRDNEEIVDKALVDIQMLSEAGLGTSAVLVLDTSRTMQGEPFTQARDAALDFLDRMGEFDHVAVVSFDDDVRVAADFTLPRTQTRLALEELQVQPKTLSKLVWDGAYKAVELVRSRPANLPRRSFVILFSDGRDSNSMHALDGLIDLAQGGPGEGRTPVFTIGYSRFGGAGLQNLDELAHRTGASSFQAASPKELGRFFDEIWKRMTESFVVQFPAEMDGANHTLEVTIDTRGDSRVVIYPKMDTPIWPWVLGIVVLALLVVGGYVLLQQRSSGRLVHEGGTRSGQVVVLKGSKVRVGALDENEVVLNFPTISRYHAQLHIRGGRVEVEDLNSKNGTFVNGTSIRARSEVKTGDRVRFGDVEMIYRK
jgi:Mg-chelatase subunit ChlD